MTPDLDALANEETARIKKSTVCWVCSIPERDWIERARKEGRSWTVISAVLVRQGHPVEMAKRHRLAYHLENHVR